MLAKRNKAAVLPTALNDNHQNTDYQASAIQSRTNLKIKLAELLFYLQKPLNQTVQRICWQDFESMLRVYYGEERL